MSQPPDDLGQQIKDAQSRQAPYPVVKQPITPQTNKAVKAGTDFIAAIVVGVFLGYLIDRWLHTTPIGIIIFLFLGFGTGFWNLYRSQTSHDDKDKKG
jgi:F0F1-type ATP synthase assembly protein I